MADRYDSFEELSKHEREGTDFRVRHEIRGSTIAVVAPHGGGIEPGTSEIALAIGGDGYSYYLFEGTKPSRNKELLHITSTRFREKRCDEVIKSCSIVVAMHGAEGGEAAVFLGGGDRVECVNRLRAAIERSLKDAKFDVKGAEATREGLKGKDDENLCNLGQSGAGIQLELTKGLRKTMFEDVETKNGRETKKPLFHTFVAALRAALRN